MQPKPAVVRPMSGIRRRYESQRRAKGGFLETTGSECGVSALVCASLELGLELALSAKLLAGAGLFILAPLAGELRR